MIKEIVTQEMVLEYLKEKGSATKKELIKKFGTNVPTKLKQLRLYKLIDYNGWDSVVTPT